ncbi:MAG: hypothetical protein CBE26_02240, partial [Kiritimatiellaceae bacterium TMED266]
GALISTNASGIAANVTAINANGALISTNASGIAANVTAIGLEATARQIADDALSARITNNERQIAVNTEEIQANRRGIAMAAALTHTTILPGNSHALDVSAATFEGETGFAVNYSGRINDNTQINFGAAGTTDGEGIYRGGVGVQW